MKHRKGFELKKMCSQQPARETFKIDDELYGGNAKKIIARYLKLNPSSKFRVWLIEKGYQIVPKIVVKARSVFNETGNTPKQLADQNAELLEVCQLAVNSQIDGSFVAAASWFERMKDVIKNATT